jgi:hypothetical protein
MDLLHTRIRELALEFRDSNFETVCFVFMNRGLDRVVFERGVSGGAQIVLVERSCFTNCIRMMQLMEHAAGKELYIVAGSLGLCVPEPVWYEWGGDDSQPFTAVKDFARCAYTGLPSVHFWLSDAPPGQPGLVYDVLDPYIVTTANVHAKFLQTRELLHGVGIVGLTKTACEAIGLRYVQASPLVTEVMMRRTLSRTRMVPL